MRADASTHIKNPAYAPSSGREPPAAPPVRVYWNADVTASPSDIAHWPSNTTFPDASARSTPRSTGHGTGVAPPAPSGGGADDGTAIDSAPTAACGAPTTAAGRAAAAGGTGGGSATTAAADSDAVTCDTCGAAEEAGPPLAAPSPLPLGTSAAYRARGS